MIPPDCELTTRHPEIPAWDSVDPKMKPVLCRQMEVYAAFLEQTDHQQDIDRFVLPMSSKLEPKFEETLLGAVTTLTGTAKLKPEANWNDQLYQPAATELTGAAPIRAIPYCTWNNRGAGKMAVWVDAAH